MRRLLVCGIGTEVGKTLVSAILVQALEAHYWKPVQAGQLNKSDTQRIQKLVNKAVCYPETYRLQHALSPHAAAALEGRELNSQAFQVPAPLCPLVIESTGGVLVPLKHDMLLIDLFSQWECEWMVVSRHYLGSINHTLLTLEALKRRKIQVRGLIFNGPPQPATENFILSYTGVKCLGHLYPEKRWNSTLIKKYADLWKSQL